MFRSTFIFRFHELLFELIDYHYRFLLEFVLFHDLKPDIYILRQFKKNIVFFYRKMDNTFNIHRNHPLIQRQQTYVLEKKI